MQARGAAGIMPNILIPLPLRQHHRPGCAVLAEHGLFVSAEMPVSGGESVIGAALSARLFGETRVGGEIHVEQRHLVEADHQIDGVRGERLARLFGVVSILRQPSESTRLDRLDAQSFRPRAAPAHGVCGHFMAAVDAFPRQPQHVALLAAMGKPGIDEKGQLHREVRPSTNASNRRQTSLGLCAAKQGGRTRNDSSCAESNTGGP